MKSYVTIFKLKFKTSIQYRKAAISGVITQVVWGLMLIVLFQLFGTSKMSKEDIATYFWISQATIAMLSIWSQDPTIYKDIEAGNVQYSLVRPQNIYVQWFVSEGAYRIARTLLRAIPMVVIALLLPEPYRLHLPANFGLLIAFMISLTLALCIQLAIGNIMAVLVLKTKQTVGVRSMFMALYDFLDGGVIPYVFFPKTFSNILKLSFFYGVRTAPLLLYLNQVSILETIILQCIWVLILISVGYLLLHQELKRIEVYGG